MTVTIEVQPETLRASRWAIVWWLDGMHRMERVTDDRALAEAYAGARHGFVVPLAALAEWPERPPMVNLMPK